jgi:hypothetical protein
MMHSLLQLPESESDEFDFNVWMTFFGFFLWHSIMCLLLLRGLKWGCPIWQLRHGLSSASSMQRATQAINASAGLAAELYCRLRADPTKASAALCRIILQSFSSDGSLRQVLEFNMILSRSSSETDASIWRIAQS